MFNIGPLELMVILVVALLVVGPKRLPEVGRQIGRSLHLLRKAQDEVTETLKLGLDEPDKSSATTRRRPAPTPASDEERAASEPEGLGPDASDEERAADVTAPVTSAAATPVGTEVTDVARTLGRSLAELRKAREEVQRTFRIDLDDLDADHHTPPSAPAAGPDVPE